jgi:hypothetical protein
MGWGGGGSGKLSPSRGWTTTIRISSLAYELYPSGWEWNHRKVELDGVTIESGREMRDKLKITGYH